MSIVQNFSQQETFMEGPSAVRGMVPQVFSVATTSYATQLYGANAPAIATWDGVSGAFSNSTLNTNSGPIHSDGRWLLNRQFVSVNVNACISLTEPTSGTPGATNEIRIRPSPNVSALNLLGLNDTRGQVSLGLPVLSSNGLYPVFDCEVIPCGQEASDTPYVSVLTATSFRARLLPDGSLAILKVLANAVTPLTYANLSASALAATHGLRIVVQGIYDVNAAGMSGL